MTELLASLQRGLGEVAGLLALRGLPYTVAFCAAPSCRWSHKLGASLLYAAVAYQAIACGQFRIGEVLSAYAYLLAICAIPFLIHRAWPQRALLFCSCAALFVVAPSARVFRNEAAMFVGWEAMLSAYSFCVDTAGTRPAFGSYVFFTFVNPAIVYSRRGTVVAPPALNGPGLLRITLGVCALLASGVIASLADRTALLATGAGAASAANKIASAYFAYSGLASVQIGFMRQIGVQVPERYPRPYAALSPREFWSRWNTYVGAWVRLYVFRPMAISLAKARLRHKALGRAAIIVASFFCIGLLHDFYASFVQQRFALHLTFWFVANAIALLTWEALATALPKGFEQRVPRLAARFGMLGLALLLAGLLP